MACFDAHRAPERMRGAPCYRLLMTFLRYAIRLDAPSRHVVAIEARFSVPAVPETDARIELTMPTWCPGSYLIRDYARFVRDLEVTDSEGTPRAVKKLDKTTWAVDPDGARELILRYI